MERLNHDQYYITMATMASLRSTCRRRHVGCVLTDINDHVLSTGYNGVPSGVPHCLDKPCLGALAPPGTALDKCEAVHAEVNAVIQCRDINEIHTCYVTVTPCVFCMRMLMNTLCKRIVSLEEYVNSRHQRLWLDLGREWIVIEDTHGASNAIRTRFQLDPSGRPTKYKGVSFNIL